MLRIKRLCMAINLQKIIYKFCYRNASSSSQLHPYVLSSPFSHRMEHIAPSWTPFNRESQNYMALGKSFISIWQIDSHPVNLKFLYSCSSFDSFVNYYV